jgi:hypothetical protein
MLRGSATIVLLQENVLHQTSRPSPPLGSARDKLRRRKRREKKVHGVLAGSKLHLTNGDVMVSEYYTTLGPVAFVQSHVRSFKVDSSRESVSH